MDLCTVIELPSKLYKGNNWCNHSNYLFIQTSKAGVCQAFANWAPKIAESSTPGVCQWNLPLPSITVAKNIKFLRFWDSSVFVTLYFVFFGDICYLSRVLLHQWLLMAMSYSRLERGE